MTLSLKNLGLALAFTALYSAQSLADTVYFQFQHVPVSSTQKQGNAELLIRVWSLGHEAHSPGLALNGTAQDHMNGIDSKHNSFHVSLGCIPRSGRDFIRKQFQIIDINEPISLREIDIKASCPANEQGQLIKPSVVSITKKPKPG